MSSPADVRFRAACARARAILDEYEACACAPDAARLEELRTRIDAELRHAGRAAAELTVHASVRSRTRSAA